MTGDPAWRRVGDRAILRTLPGDVAVANRTALALYRAVGDRGFAEVVDLVPGARSLLVVLAEGAEPSDSLIEALSAPDAAENVATDQPLHSIPVTYDGLDLAEVARSAGVSEEEVVRLHSAAEYTVAFVGFSPGFPYLLGLDARLATRRLDTPRVRVPAGSVAIGGPWTGVYPRATPGGWHLIGRTDVELFDPGRDPPALVAPGDRVRFVPR